MLIYHRTSILESAAQTVVNTVNCVGVMGKGIAAAYKQRYPNMFHSYKKICDDKQLEPGKLWLWQRSEQWVLNFPTKKHWRNPSRLEWIQKGLEKFVEEYERRGIVEISFPRLGCGNGGLILDDVRPMMEHYLSRLPIQVYVHDYEVDLGFPEHLVRELHEGDAAESLRTSYDHFVHALDRVLNLAAGTVTDLESKRQFSARFLDDLGLAIEVDGLSQLVDHDELRGIWVSLQKGLLTRQAAERSAGHNAGRLLSLIGLLPNVRAVQVQRPQADHPEIAVELRHQRSIKSAENDRREQLTLSWP